MDDLILRDFVDADFVSLYKLWASTCVGNPARGDSLASIQKTLAAGGRLLVLAAGDLIVGSCWLTDDGRRLYVHHMAVLPEMQDRGLGRRLLEKAVAIAAERDLQMKLEVAADNERAIHLYRKLGFDFIGDYEVMLKRSIG